MTHTGPIAENAGTFDAPQATQCHCRACDEQTVTVQTWDSNDGAFTDYKYTCSSCGHTWWIDGPDA